MPKLELKPRAVLDDRGRIVIPKIVREALNLKKGDLAEIEVYGKDKIVLTFLGKR